MKIDQFSDVTPCSLIDNLLRVSSRLNVNFRNHLLDYPTTHLLRR